jgi:ribonucleoside-diphosphate reductase beta chain
MAEEEIDLSANHSHYQELSPGEKHFLSSHVLTFFTTADGIINEDLLPNFASVVQSTKDGSGS